MHHSTIVDISWDKLKQSVDPGAAVDGKHCIPWPADKGEETHMQLSYASPMRVAHSVGEDRPCTKTMPRENLIF